MRLKWQDSENGATTKKACLITNWLPFERLITLIYINEVKNDAKKTLLQDMVRIQDVRKCGV